MKCVYIQSYTNRTSYEKSFSAILPIESLITYCIYKFCSPIDVKLHFIYSCGREEKHGIKILDDSLTFADINDLPWQVTSCVYPVALHEDTVITGLCAISRHIAKHRSHEKSDKENEEGILGFRKGCLQAPNEVSVWTKFCEIDIIKSVKQICNSDIINEIPENLVRFETHLSKPVKLHNIYKIAQDLNKNKKIIDENELSSKSDKNVTGRVPKPRKWKSSSKKDSDIAGCTKIKDLGLNHEYAEGPFLTLADLVLLPSYSVIVTSIGMSILENVLPLTIKWYNNLMSLPELDVFNNIHKIEFRKVLVKDLTLPATDGASLYKSDPTRHNPKKRMFTKENDIINALESFKDDMKLDISNIEFNKTFNWSDIPDGANPSAGHLPDNRVCRKAQQLENLVLAVLNSNDGDKIVDFCSGSGHLGILIAYLLPKCTVIILENKEQSLMRARKRVHDMNLKNVYFFQCNLDFFIGSFDIGVALHACGIATDLVLDKCLKANAKFVLSPCCYGSLHSTDRLVYPRSNKFRGITLEQYLCIGHTADQTHDNHPLTVRGDLCMALIDSDRGRLAEEHGYKVTLSRLKPLSCTPKNNLLIGVPS